MVSFIERQETYTAFRHNLAICGEKYQLEEDDLSIPSHWIATCAAMLEHRVNAASTSDTAYRDMVEKANQDLQLFEEGEDGWWIWLEFDSGFPDSFWGLQDVIRPTVFANLLVADVQHSRELLEKSISSINAAIFKRANSANFFLSYYLKPEEVQEMAKHIEFWDVRALGTFNTIIRGRYRKEVSRIIEELESWETKELWDLWCNDVARHMNVHPLHKPPKDKRTLALHKRKAHPRRYNKFAFVQDTHVKIDGNRKSLEASGTRDRKIHSIDGDSRFEAPQKQGRYNMEETHQAKTCVASKYEGDTVRSKSGSSFSQAVAQSGPEHAEIEEASPVTTGFQSESTLPSPEHVKVFVPSSPTTTGTDILPFTSRRLGIQALLWGADVNLPFEDQKVIIEEKVAAARSLTIECAKSEVQGRSPAAGTLLDSLQGSEAAHMGQKSASCKTPSNKSAHVPPIGAAQGNKSPIIRPPPTHETSAFVPPIQEGFISGGGSESNADFDIVVPATEYISDADKEVLLSLLHSHTVPKEKAASRPKQATTSTASQTQVPHTIQKTHPSIDPPSPYTIFGSNATSSSTLNNNLTYTDSPSEISLPHASNLISLSLFLLEQHRSRTTLPSPLCEIFDASITGINAWLDQPRIWSEPEIAATLDGEVEVLRDVWGSYEELVVAREGIKNIGREQVGEDMEMWHVLKNAEKMYVVALRGLGRRIPEGDRGRFMEMLGGEEGMMASVVVGKRSGAGEDDGEQGEDREKSGVEKLD